MFDVRIIEVAIGLSLTFALLGVVASAVQEAIANWLGLRGNELRRGMVRLLGDDDALGDEVVEEMYAHPLIRRLGEGRGRFGISKRFWKAIDRPDRAPSYIPARTFATVLLDVLGRSPSIQHGGPLPGPHPSALVDALPEGDLRDLLRCMVDEASATSGQVHATLEAWFDDAMDRVSGWYRRRSRRLLFAIGLAMAVFMNFDAIRVARHLMREPQARAVLVGAAQAQLEAQTTDSKDAMETLKGLDLPIGWSSPSEEEMAAPIPPIPASGCPLTVLGWLVTALAISLGSAFWFDALGKLMSLRSAGTVPERRSEHPAGGGTGLSPGAVGPPRPPTGPGSVEAEMTEDDIRDLQRALKVSTTGVLDDETRRAIADFRAAQPEGSLDAQTIRRILARG